MGGRFDYTESEVSLEAEAPTEAPVCLTKPHC